MVVNLTDPLLTGPGAIGDGRSVNQFQRTRVVQDRIPRPRVLPGADSIRVARSR